MKGISVQGRLLHSARLCLLALWWLLGSQGCVFDRSQFRELVPERKVVFITGSASGIGKATALEFLERGHIVYGADIQVDSNLYLKDIAGGHAIEMDVREQAQVDAAVARVVAEQGHLDVVINNAGYGSYGPVESVPIEEIKNQYDVNVFGYMRVIKAAKPQLRQQGYGRVVMITSVVGEVSLPMMGYYASTKHAMEALSDALRAEVRHLGIDVIKVQPGPVDTHFDEVAMARLAEAQATSPAEYQCLIQHFKGFHQGLYAAASSPDRMARKIARAALRRRAPARVRAPLTAKAVVAANRLTSERRFDALVLFQYGRPKAGRGVCKGLEER